MVHMREFALRCWGRIDWEGLELCLFAVGLEQFCLDV